MELIAFERDEPKANEVEVEIEIEVLYCGVCHSDVHQVKKDWGNTVYPCMPGHANFRFRYVVDVSFLEGEMAAASSRSAKLAVRLQFRLSGLSLQE